MTVFVRLMAAEEDIFDRSSVKSCIILKVKLNPSTLTEVVAA